MKMLKMLSDLLERASVCISWLNRGFVNNELSHLALKKHKPLAVGHVTVGIADDSRFRTKKR
jgi:hypothetical protein